MFVNNLLYIENNIYLIDLGNMFLENHWEKKAMKQHKFYEVNSKCIHELSCNITKLSIQACPYYLNNN